MPRRITIALISAAVVVLAYPITAWVIGFIVESQINANEQRVIAEAPYVVVVKRDYHRGIYTSTEETTYQLSLPLAQGASKNPFEQLRLTVRHRIHHGPLPRLQAFALATVDSDVELPAAVNQDVRAMLGGRSPVELHTRMGWLGGSTSSFNSPAFTLKLDSGTAVTWQGISGTVEASRGLAAWSGSIRAPGLTIDGESTHAELGMLTFSADMRRVYDTLATGKASFKMASATIRSPGDNGDVVLKGLTLRMLSSQKGDYLDSGGELAAETLEAKQFSATHLGFAFSFNHLHGPSLAALTTAVRDLQREALTGNRDVLKTKLSDTFREHGIDVLLHDPVVEVPRIGFVMPEGEMHLSANARAPGLTREELQGPALKAAILQHLQAQADLRVDAALMDRLLSANANGHAAQQQLVTLERQGYLKHEGSQYTVHIAYQSGKLSVNGQPFPPVGPR